MRTLSTTHTTRHVEVKWRKGKSCFSRNTDEQGIPEEAEKTENSGSIVLHLGSPCFDAVAIVWAAFAVIMGNLSLIHISEPTRH